MMPRTRGRVFASTQVRKSAACQLQGLPASTAQYTPHDGAKKTSFANSLAHCVEKNLAAWARLVVLFSRFMPRQIECSNPDMQLAPTPIWRGVSRTVAAPEASRDAPVSPSVAVMAGGNILNQASGFPENYLLTSCCLTPTYPPPVSADCVAHSRFSFSAMCPS